MSFLPLTSQFALCASFFELEVLVCDTAYVTTNGEDRLTDLGSRTINAAVDVSAGQRLEQMFGGSVSDGDIGITTSDDLFIGDSYVVGAAQKQSYITWEGLEYRVTDLAPWKQHTGKNVYLAKRHVKQDNPINNHGDF